MSTSNQLRSLIERDELLFCPGIYDPYSARVAEEFGPDALYMSGSGTSSSVTGYADAGFITMTEMVTHANSIQQTIDIPLIADADTGFGDAKNVIRTVREYIKTGVGGIHIEDQLFPKRCGQVRGKQVISKDEAVGKYQAAGDVRDELNEDFVIIARTDAIGAPGGSLDDAIDRANAYCEAGADVAFVEGPTTPDEVEYVGEHVEYPLLYNYGSISPRLEFNELAEFGYNIAIYNFAQRAALVALFDSMEKLMNDPISEMHRLREEMDELPIENRRNFAGFDDVVEWEKQYLPDDVDARYAESIGDEIG